MVIAVSVEEILAIQPSENVGYDLDALVGGINARNVHDEFSFGQPVDKEAR